MNCTAEMLRLYAVTDRAWVGEQTLPQQVEAALKGGAPVCSCGKKIWRRSHSGRGAGDLRPLQTVRRAVHSERQRGAGQAVRGRRCASGAGGYGPRRSPAHPWPGGHHRRVGPQCGRSQSRCGGRCGLSGCGAMFATATKTNVTALPKETLRAICTAVPIPVVAIGGIHKQNLLSLAHCGEAVWRWSAPSSRLRISRPSAGN